MGAIVQGEGERDTHFPCALCKNKKHQDRDRAASRFSYFPISVNFPFFE